MYYTLLLKCFYFVLHCYVAATPTLKQLTLLKWENEHGQTQRLRILEDVCTKWKNIGTLIGLTAGRLNIIEVDRHDKPEDCCREVFDDWLKQGDQGSYPMTWDSMCTLLEDLNFIKTAKEIGEWQRCTH